MAKNAKIKHTKTGAEFKITDYYSKDMSIEDMQTERRRLAKVVNQRMLRMHRETSAITGERYDEWGSVTYVKDYLEREGRNKFSESKNYTADYSQLRKELTILRSFVESGSSTVGQQKKIEAKRVATFSSGKWGSRYDSKGRKIASGYKLKTAGNKSFYDFLNSSIYKQLSEIFPSEEIIEMYDSAVVKTGGEYEKVMEAMEEAYGRFTEESEFGLKDFEAYLGLTPFDREEKTDKKVRGKRVTKNAKSNNPKKGRKRKR